MSPWTEPTPAEAEMIDEFAADMVGLVRAVPQDRREGVKKALGGIYGMLIALRRQVRELQARPTLKYAGAWKSNDEYVESSLVSHSGSLFIATIKSKGLRPGDGSGWKLVCKRGRDGRDLRA